MISKIGKRDGLWTVMGGAYYHCTGEWGQWTESDEGFAAKKGRSPGRLPLVQNENKCLQCATFSMGSGCWMSST